MSERARARARRRARVCERAYVRATGGNRISAFVGAGPDSVDRDLESAVNVELAAAKSSSPRPYYAITCRGKDARPFLASLIRRH